MKVGKATGPFSPWPVQLFDERFGFAWYTEPCALVTQLTHPRATVELVSAVHDAIDHIIEVKKREIEEHGGLLIFHDWRTMIGYDSQARVVFLERMRARKKGYLRQVVAVLADKPIVKMGVATANVVMALGVGGSLKITTDPWPAFRESEIAKPDSDRWP